MDKTPERPKSKRRFVRFSLKTFLIVITLLGVVAGPSIYRAERQKRIVQWWVDGGGLFGYDFEYDDNGNYLPKAEAPGPAFLDELIGMDYFATLIRLDPGNVVDDLSRLADQKKLQYLGVRTTSDNLAPLSSLVNLKRFELRDSPVSDLTPLSGQASIEMLSLSNMPVSDLTPLIGLPNLKTLVVTEMPVGDDEIARFKQAMPNCEVKINR